MKTKELRNFYQRLSDLNNSYSHYSFVWKQFIIEYSSLFQAKPDDFTSQVFYSNNLAGQHNVKLNCLPNEHNKTHKTLTQGIFLLIYTHFEEYLKLIISFSRSVDSEIDALENKIDGLENDRILIDKVFNRIELTNDILEEEVKFTLDYLRLRRNRMIHSNSIEISHSLNEIIKPHGKKLNAFWNGRLKGKLRGINFESKGNLNELTFEIIIDVINIFRKISAIIDDKIIEKLTIEKILKNLIFVDFEQNHLSKIKNLEKERIFNKFRRFCSAEYSLHVSDSQIIDLFGNIA